MLSRLRTSDKREEAGAMLFSVKLIENISGNPVELPKGRGGSSGEVRAEFPGFDITEILGNSEDTDGTDSTNENSSELGEDLGLLDVGGVPEA